MAQMPIQLYSGRAAPYAEALPALRAPTAYPVDRSDVSGGISGGLLRPGAIDQAQFRAYLEAAQGRAGAQARGFSPPVPTLTPAQLAALGVDLGNAAALPAAPAKPALDLSAGYMLDPVPAVRDGSADGAGDSAAAQIGSVEPASATDVADQALAALGAKPAAQAAGARPGPMPRSRMGADGVWELPRLPDKDEREMLRGQKWRIVEDPAARELFLGPDGEFGWDDFVDLINPLQHIPLVNIAYRAITGDEINGAARLVDFAFGPVAGVSTALDLAFRDVAGGSMASTAVAALFGSEESGEALTEYTTAAAIQVADSGRRGSHR